MITHYRRPVIFNLLDQDGEIIKTNSVASGAVHYNDEKEYFVVSVLIPEGRHLVSVRRAEGEEVMIVDVTHLEEE